jgi:hypothetical protein
MTTADVAERVDGQRAGVASVAAAGGGQPPAEPARPASGACRRREGEGDCWRGDPKAKRIGGPPGNHDPGRQDKIE